MILFAATGALLRRLPMTPARVLEEIAKGRARPVISAGFSRP